VTRRKDWCMVLNACSKNWLNWNLHKSCKYSFLTDDWSINNVQWSKSYKVSHLQGFEQECLSPYSWVASLQRVYRRCIWYVFSRQSLEFQLSINQIWCIFIIYLSLLKQLLWITARLLINIRLVNSVWSDLER
jgi:hypothetical protein